ncbi:hydroxymethylglutaryl-CoA lyase [Salsipaludibacter albus]|uniref:hydroxymethylglutaryl-CoA lyase n=1 Tax=Salsipaludibacter albus TaxID=2849650 RepID=UPI001EE46712|nr:hydroxymethylglutaryl-CoA lyase [Salsipaludibacter albus]MBY5161723.1 hydroxymethylglutaryl-CoA lyase [Salsipaludibacter albus]
MRPDLPEQVRIVEVGPRDGLQNEPGVVPTEVKVAFIDRLSATGLQAVEVTSFVHPKWVPQLADAAEVMAAIGDHPGVAHPVLVPNEVGLDKALAAGATEVAVFAAASEAFSQANLNTDIAGSLAMFAPVVQRAREAGLDVRGYVSTVLGCPFQGDVPHDDVLRVTAALLEMGVYEVSLGDTIGVGTPGAMQDLLDRLVDEVGVASLAVHCHDTYGQGLANTLAAFEVGVTTADASAGGLGGCPFAPGATGNLATEDLVYALHGSGVATGVDLDALVDTSAWMARRLGRPSPSRVVTATLATRETADR